MDKIELSPKTKKFLLDASPYWIGALAITIIVMGAIDVLTPAKPMSYFTLFGITLPSFIPTFLLICMGLSWLLHGFGFIIIKG